MLGQRRSRSGCGLADLSPASPRRSGPPGRQSSIQCCRRGARVPYAGVGRRTLWICDDGASLSSAGASDGFSQVRQLTWDDLAGVDRLPRPDGAKRCCRTWSNNRCSRSNAFRCSGQSTTAPSIWPSAIGPPLVRADGRNRMQRTASQPEDRDLLGRRRRRPGPRRRDLLGPSRPGGSRRGVALIDRPAVIGPAPAAGPPAAATSGTGRAVAGAARSCQGST